MKNKVSIIILGVMLVCVPVFAAAQDGVSVRAFTDRKSILAGDRIKYTIKVVAKKGYEVKFPVFAGYKIGDFEIKDFTTTSKTGFFGSRVFLNTYSITAYSPGKYTIPEAEVKYKSKSDKDWLTAKASGITITVDSVLSKEGKLSDIKDVKGPLSIREINWVLIILLVVLAVAAIFIIRWIRRKPKPIKLPHETALEELEAIKAEYLRSGDVKEYYSTSSDCIRHYIERAFRLKAPEMTTEEFLNSLKDSSSLSQEHKDLLKGFLNASDLVKFAKYAPARQEVEAVFVTATKFVEETKGIFEKKEEGKA